jgi:5,10-methylenetetrahydromethanopterin reductase
MKFGVLVSPGAHSPQQVMHAEENGFDSAFFIDSPVIFGDPYISMTAAAVQTKTIMLSTGVTNPLTRSAVMTAANMASINAFAPGRVALGIGVGHTGTEVLGLRNAKLKELEDYIANIRKFNHGEIVELELLGQNVFTQFINQDASRINITNEFPVYVAATAPKILALAGRIASGIILGGITNVQVIEDCRRYIEEGAKSVGRDIDDIEIAITPSVYVTEQEPTFEHLREVIGPKSLAPARTSAILPKCRVIVQRTLCAIW